jgi:hypothetical protein
VASDQFVAAVAAEMQRILNGPDAARLGLAADIVDDCQGYFSRHSAAAMVEKIKSVGRDNGINLDNYEPFYARGAAEMILSMVDRSYRRALAPKTMT